MESGWDPCLFVEVSPKRRDNLTFSASLPATRVEGGHEAPSHDTLGHLGGEPFDPIQNPALLVGR